MNNNQLYYQYNPWWEKSFTLENIIIRKSILTQLIAAKDSDDIIILTGLRRVGKTISMKLLIQHLLENRIKPQHVFYMSMDDYLLKDKTIIEVIDSYRQLQKVSVHEKIYVFLDEITHVKNFRQQLKNLYDKGNIKLFASSSSSSVLRDDSAYLTGRRKIIEVNPLCFDEYLLFKNIKISKADTGLYESYFEEYLLNGGMPEYVLRGDRGYLAALIDDILMKDIVAYHGIRNPHIIRDYFMLLMERVGKQISINKAANILSISPDTAKRYLKMFEETYLIHLVPRYGKTNETLLSAKKVYAADLGIRNVVTGFRDKGALFENVVYLAIKSQHPRYIYESGGEIDFMTDQHCLIEAKYHNHLQNKQLELFNRIKAQKKFVIRDYWELKKFLDQDKKN